MLEIVLAALLQLVPTHRVVLTWELSTDDVVGGKQVVYRAAGSTDTPVFVPIATLPSGVTEYVDGAVVEGEYWYQVSFVGADGTESDVTEDQNWLDVLVGPVPAPPTGLVVIPQ